MDQLTDGERIYFEKLDRRNGVYSADRYTKSTTENDEEVLSSNKKMDALYERAYEQYSGEGAKNNRGTSSVRRGTRLNRNNIRNDTNIPNNHFYSHSLSEPEYVHMGASINTDMLQKASDSLLRDKNDFVMSRIVMPSAVDTDEYADEEEEEDLEDTHDTKKMRSVSGRDDVEVDKLQKKTRSISKKLSCGGFNTMTNQGAVIKVSKSPKVSSVSSLNTINTRTIHENQVRTSRDVRCQVKKYRKVKNGDKFDVSQNSFPLINKNDKPLSDMYIKKDVDIHGVSFCDCLCEGCYIHSSNNDSTKPKGDGITTCYYRQGRSKTEYCIRDSRWGSIDHIDIVRTLVDDINKMEKVILPVQSKVSIAFVCELLDMSQMTIPYLASVFYRHLDDTVDIYAKSSQPNTSNNTSQRSKKCYTTKLEKQNGTIIETSMDSKRENDISSKICFNSCRYPNNDNNNNNNNTNTNKKGEKIINTCVCVIIDSSCSTDSRFLIRTCLSMDIKDTYSISNKDNSIDHRSSNNYSDTSSSSHYQSDEMNSAANFLKIISELNKEDVISLPHHGQTRNSNNEQMSSISSPIQKYGEHPVFFDLHKLSVNISRKSTIWNKLKCINVWTYVRSFIILCPDK